MAAVGIGSDTGGSVRIPAALCGLTGFKPTARRVATDGMLPLVPSLDSVGPIAPTVACCAVVDAVLAGERVRSLKIPHLSSLRLGLLQGYVLDGLDSAVGGAFERAIGRLRAGGARVMDVSFDGLERIAVSNRIGPVEAFAWHRAMLEKVGERIDPRVLVRMQAGSTMLASEYLDLLRVRREIVASASAAFAGYDALLLPTTAWIAPPIASLEGSDSAYFAANTAMLRNPSIFNYLDGCALSVPCHLPGEAPVGLMVAGLGGWDDAVLQVGSAVEFALSLPG